MYGALINNRPLYKEQYAEFRKVGEGRRIDPYIPISSEQNINAKYLLSDTRQYPKMIAKKLQFEVCIL